MDGVLRRYSRIDFLFIDAGAALPYRKIVLAEGWTGNEIHSGARKGDVCLYLSKSWHASPSIFTGRTP